MARLALLVSACSLAIALPAVAQEPLPGICDIRPNAPECQGGGGTDPGDPSEVEGDMVWGAFDQLTSVCPGTPPRPQYLQRLVWTTGASAGTHVHVSDFAGSFGPGDPVPNGPVGAVFAADGYAYRWVCSDPSVAEDVWEEARELMLPIAVEKSPYVAGLTGLETWVWYSGQTTVEPFQVAWIDPATSIGWILEARAWVATHEWNMGDGEMITTQATVFADGATAGGTEDDPAGTHTYRTTSAQSGYADGFPFTFEATWVGEYRWWSTATSSWSAWVPMANTFTDAAALTYEVVQVRSSLVSP